MFESDYKSFLPKHIDFQLSFSDWNYKLGFYILRSNKNDALLIKIETEDTPLYFCYYEEKNGFPFIIGDNDTNFRDEIIEGDYEYDSIIPYETLINQAKFCYYFRNDIKKNDLQEETKIIALVSYLEYLDIDTGSLFKFSDINLNDILCNYIIYRIEKDFNFPHRDYTEFQLEIKALLQEDDTKVIVEFLQTKNELHIFSDLYAYMEHKIGFENEPSLQLCSACDKNNNLCKTCRGKAGQIIPKTRYKLIKRKLGENTCWSENANNTDFHTYRNLRKHRNALFHRNNQYDHSKKKILKDFHECLYYMLLTIVVASQPSVEN